MRCPVCGSKSSPYTTIGDHSRNDNRTYRARRCVSKGCGKTFSTLEILRTDLAAEEEETSKISPKKSFAIPMNAPSPKDDKKEDPKKEGDPKKKGLIDLEARMEELLPEALTTISNALKLPESPDKVRVDLAKWVVDDRRKWRVQLAEQNARAGISSHEDSSIAQLTNILRLIPDQEAEG
jgi:hypothetical protein